MLGAVAGARCGNLRGKVECARIGLVADVVVYVTLEFSMSGGWSSARIVPPALTASSSKSTTQDARESGRRPHRRRGSLDKATQAVCVAPMTSRLSIPDTLLLPYRVLDVQRRHDAFAKIHWRRRPLDGNRGEIGKVVVGKTMLQNDSAATTRAAGVIRSEPRDQMRSW